MTKRSHGQVKARPGGKTIPPEFPSAVSQKAPGWLTGLAYGLTVFFAVMLMIAFALTLGVNTAAARFSAEGWGPYASVIADNRVTAIWHGVFMLAVATAVVWIRIRFALRRTLSNALAWGMVLLVAGDAGYLSRHYVLTQSTGMLAENDVVRVLKNDPKAYGRVALVSQDGFYNQWLTYLFPYHGIRTLNITQMPRMPEEYRRFLDSVGRYPLRFWQLGAVDYVLAPAQVWMQIERDPDMKEAFDLIFAYNIAPSEEGVNVLPGTKEQPGQHVILRLRAPSPMYAVFSGWSIVDDDTAIRSLSSPGSPVFERVLIAKETADGLAPSDNEGFDENVQQMDRRSGFARLKVSVTRPSILRIAEKYDADWKATVDGKPVSLLRVDYLFQGVPVPPGVHEIVLRYAPSNGAFWIQMLGIAVVVSAGVYLVVQRRRTSEKGPP